MQKKQFTKTMVTKADIFDEIHLYGLLFEYWSKQVPCPGCGVLYNADRKRNRLQNIAIELFGTVDKQCRLCEQKQLHQTWPRVTSRGNIGNTGV